MNSFRPIRGLFLFFTLLFSAQEAWSWGFYAHRIINEKAVYALPSEMFGFYKANIDYLIEHSVDPDKRRYSVKEEGPRHYVDLDRYNIDGNDVLVSVKRENLLRWDSALTKYGEDSLKEGGILPWHLNLMIYRLTRAFEEKDFVSALKISAEIGHYASDANVPLHTTENYNGQLTGQKGIHSLWESRIPERKAKNFDFFIEGSRYLENQQLEIWKVISESHEKVEYVLKTERNVRDSFDPDKVYRPSTLGRKVSPQYTSAYVEEYCKSNESLVKEKMLKSAQFTASIWYTAWVKAGQPPLPEVVLEKNNKSNYEVKEDELEHTR